MRSKSLKIKPNLLDYAITVKSQVTNLLIVLNENKQIIVVTSQRSPIAIQETVNPFLIISVEMIIVIVDLAAQTVIKARQVQSRLAQLVDRNVQIQTWFHCLAKILIQQNRIHLS